MDQTYKSFQDHLEDLYCKYFDVFYEIFVNETFCHELFHSYLSRNPNVPTKYLLSLKDKSDIRYYLCNKAFTQSLFNSTKQHYFLYEKMICQPWITPDIILENEIIIHQNIITSSTLSFDDLIYLKNRDYKYIVWDDVMENMKIPHEMVTKYPDFEWENYFMKLYDNMNISDSFFEHERFHAFLNNNYKCTLENVLVNRHKLIDKNTDEIPFIYMSSVDKDLMMLEMIFKIKTEIKGKEEKDEATEVPWHLVFEYPNFNFWKMDDIFESIPWSFDIESETFYAHFREYSFELNRFIDGLTQIGIDFHKANYQHDTLIYRYFTALKRSVIKALIKNFSLTDEQLADEFRKFNSGRKIARQLEKSYLDPQYTYCINRLKNELMILQNDTI